MRFLIEHPPSFSIERNYIYDVIIGQRLGFDWVARCSDTREIVISVLGDSSGRKVYLNDSFFSMLRSCWGSRESLPRQPISLWHVTDIFRSALQPRCRDLPVIYGQSNNSNILSKRPLGFALNIDIFGSAFFMLTRYEEYVSFMPDSHGRFAGVHLLAAKEGFLHRPIIDEYVEILWEVLIRTWPGLSRRLHNYRVQLSHDVDHFSAAIEIEQIHWLRSCAGDIILRRNPLLAARRFLARYTYEILPGIDPYNSYDWLMNISEKYGLQSAFYFLCQKNDSRRYNIEGPRLRKLIRRIFDRGHEIGYHASYVSYMDPYITKEEFELLLRVAEEEGVRQNIWGARQHYLRWRNPITWQNLNRAGCHYDTTLGFADLIGFRCGTSHEFKVFDLQERKPLNLIERPLIVMDQVLLNQKHQKLTEQQLINCIEYYAQTCRHYGGVFTLLWHNSTLLTSRYKKLYQKLVEAVVRA